MAKDIMTVHPKSIESGELAVDALDIMRKKNITQLVVTENNHYAGIIHFCTILCGKELF